MKLDFLECLQEYLNAKELVYECRTGDMEEEKLMLYPASGNQIIHQYYNNVVDKEYNCEFALKTRNNWGSYSFLTKVGTLVEEIEELPSKNGSYDFHLAKVKSIPSPIVLEDGYLIYTLTVQVNLTTY